MPNRRTLRTDGMGLRLSETRAERGISLRDLASLAGLAHGTIHDMEAERFKPTADSIEKIAIALQVSPAWLAYGIGPKVLPAEEAAPAAVAKKKPAARAKPSR